MSNNISRLSIRYVLIAVVWSICFCLPMASADETDAPKKTLPLAGEVFTVNGHVAFLIPAQNVKAGSTVPWVWYAPTLPNLPSDAEKWMFEKFTAAGIAIAGIDAGESYGSPNGNRLYSALYEELTERRGYSKKPVLLGRSRGGLMTLSWAVNNPEKVGGWAGIYPVCNLSSYPGLSNAASAFELSAEDLEKRLVEFNPVDRFDSLAEAKVPLFAIHGDVDTVVPLEKNTGLLKSRLEEKGWSLELIVPKGQGHNMWDGFFQCSELVDFVIKHAH
ncbi:MAG: alpha/beta hydrolase [Planctomycetaceae bacterium]|nr:alpha/beta hydrolase [Planctomycetaceae bacterium]